MLRLLLSTPDQQIHGLAVHLSHEREHTPNTRRPRRRFRLIHVHCNLLRDEKGLALGVSLGLICHGERRSYPRLSQKVVRFSPLQKSKISIEYRNMNKEFEEDLAQVLLSEDDTYSACEPCLCLTKTDLFKLWERARSSQDEADLATLDKLWSLAEDPQR